MKKTKMLFAVLSLVILATIIAGCGSDSNTTTTPGALAVTTVSLTGATINTAYSQTLTASGGTAPYVWSISVGSLPAGLLLNTSTGAITGTPTALATANFSVTVTDSATPAGTATKALSITVGSTPPPPPVFDALAFYNASCINTGAGCHTALGVRSAAQITNAIANFSAMTSRFSATGSTPLTAAQISAIAAVSH